MCNAVPYGSFGDTMGLKDVSEVAQELHELLCDISWEIEDPEERDAFVVAVADAFVQLVRNQQ